MGYGRCILELARDSVRSPAQAIAHDDSIAARVGSGASPPTLRLWDNGRALVVPAWRLRNHSDAGVIDRFGRIWPICARSSGGTAVAHGPGTLNLSLIVPGRGPFQPSIDDGYQLWIGLLDAALCHTYGLAIEAVRVEGAFCNGRSDAVVEGRKLAGVSQARRNGSVLIHGTILTHVDCAEYLRVIEAGERLLGISVRMRYDPERIVSLHELVGRAVGVRELADAISRAFLERYLARWMLAAEAPSGPAEPDSYVYDHEDPTPTVGGSILPAVYTCGSVDVGEVRDSDGREIVKTRDNE